MIYWQLLWVYLKIGILGFGGGYAMLSLIQHEVVDKGAVVATIAVCLPSFLMVLAISYCFVKFRTNKFLKVAFAGLRPMTVSLIAAAVLLLINKENFIDYKSLIIFVMSFILLWKYNLHPISMICLAGVAGLILYW